MNNTIKIEQKLKENDYENDVEIIPDVKKSWDQISENVKDDRKSNQVVNDVSPKLRENFCINAIKAFVSHFPYDGKKKIEDRGEVEFPSKYWQDNQIYVTRYYKEITYPHTADENYASEYSISLAQAGNYENKTDHSKERMIIFRVGITNQLGMELTESDPKFFHRPQEKQIEITFRNKWYAHETDNPGGISVAIHCNHEREHHRKILGVGSKISKNQLRELKI